MNIFVTGGAGFIGSHTCVALLEAGHSVVVFDNFSNSSPKALERVALITGKQPIIINGDVRDSASIKAALLKHSCDAVIHFAGLKAVGESVKNPLVFYDNNVSGTVSLLIAMNEVGIKTLVFSSSATVYGNPVYLPIKESHPLSATNPYGNTKLIIENMLHDLHSSLPEWRIGVLRYFNPVGAHESGLIGEDPAGVPDNLLPFVAQVAVGRREFLNVWGNDYPTPDGTGVRDYIHVVDLALGHIMALEHLASNPCKFFTVNLGTGLGSSVLDVVHAFEKASGCNIPYKICPRRLGDVPAYYADASAANTILGWKAKKGLGDMCVDVWRWQSKNPKGYE